MIFDRTRAYHVDDGGATTGARRPRRSRSPTTWASSRTRRGMRRATETWTSIARPSSRSASTTSPSGTAETPARPLEAALPPDGRQLALAQEPRFLPPPPRAARGAGRWDGGLVLVGGKRVVASSVAAERRFWTRTRPSPGACVDLGHVEEPDQLALYRDAELVLFPVALRRVRLHPLRGRGPRHGLRLQPRSAMGELLPAAGAPSLVRPRRGGGARPAAAREPDRARALVAEITRGGDADLGPDRGRVPGGLRAGAEPSRSGRRSPCSAPRASSRVAQPPGQHEALCSTSTGDAAAAAWSSTRPFASGRQCVAGVRGLGA